MPPTDTRKTGNRQIKQTCIKYAKPKQDTEKPLELGPHLCDLCLINLESLCQEVTGDIRLRTEYCIGYGDDTRVLAAKSCNGDGITITVVPLVEDKSNWEQENIALLQDFGDEPVLGVGSHEPNLKAAFQKGQHFGGTWVSVGRVDPPWGKVDAFPLC